MEAHSFIVSGQALYPYGYFEYVPACEYRCQPTEIAVWLRLRLQKYQYEYFCCAVAISVL